jgi:S-adenosyl methyltransferase
MTTASDWQPPVDLHTDRPHPARVYDVLLGGKTNYKPDRDAAQAVIDALPTAVMSAKANRGFMHRAVRHLVGEAGIRQFLDIGTGIPTSPNLHEVAQEVAPDARIVYADNDPIVLAHSRALHTGTPEGRTAYIPADVTTPETILGSEELHATLDLKQPVALTLLLLMHWIPKKHDPYALVGRLLDALPSGSYLALSHITNDFDADGMGRVEEDLEEAGSGVVARSHAQIAQFFSGLEMIEPGLVVPQRWRPPTAQIEGSVAGEPDTRVSIYAGVARKP